MEGLRWWGYLHINGSIQVKRYFDNSYQQDCTESNFVVNWTQPFEAESRAEAIKIVEEKLRPKKKKEVQTVTVSAAALRDVLQALNGPAHYIRELQCTMGLPGSKNSLEVLIADFNEQIAKQKETGVSNGKS